MHATSASPPCANRRPRQMPLSRLSGATPTSLAICRSDRRRSSGRSPSSHGDKPHRSEPTEPVWTRFRAHSGARMARPGSLFQSENVKNRRFSVARMLLPKLDVASSSPVARSELSATIYRCGERADRRCPVRRALAPTHPVPSPCAATYWRASRRCAARRHRSRTRRTRSHATCSRTCSPTPTTDSDASP